MDELYGEFFRAMHQFRKLNVAVNSAGHQSGGICGDE